jgi:hypothetical protein
MNDVDDLLLCARMRLFSVSRSIFSHNKVAASKPVRFEIIRQLIAPANASARASWPRLEQALSRSLAFFPLTNKRLNGTIFISEK